MLFASVAAGLFSTGAGLFGASGQRGADKEQVDLAYKDNLEKIRRREFEQEQTFGQAQAFSQNAGVRHTGGSTAQGFLDTMSFEFKKELDWMKEFANKSRSSGMDRANINYSTNVMGAIKGGLSTGSNVYGLGS